MELLISFKIFARLFSKMNRIIRRQTQLRETWELSIYGSHGRTNTPYYYLLLGALLSIFTSRLIDFDLS